MKVLKSFLAVCFILILSLPIAVAEEAETSVECTTYGFYGLDDWYYVQILDADGEVSEDCKADDWIVTYDEGAIGQIIETEDFVKFQRDGGGGLNVVAEYDGKYTDDNLLILAAAGVEVEIEEVELDEEDNENPGAVQYVVATPLDSKIQLTWDEATDNVGVTGYFVEYGVNPVEDYTDTYDQSIDVGNVTEYLVEDLENGTTYYFGLYAYDAAGNESANWSVEVDATPSGDTDEDESTDCTTYGFYGLDDLFYVQILDADGEASEDCKADDWILTMGEYSDFGEAVETEDEVYFEIYAGGMVNVVAEYDGKTTDDNYLYITPGAEDYFTDVDEDSEQEILYLAEQGVVEGQSEGYYAIDDSVNRAEMIKILLELVGEEPSVEDYNNCFDDVTDDWYAPYVCFAKEYDIVRGYDDGNFRPANPVSYAESLKITLNIFNFGLTEDGDEWYSEFVDKSEEFGLISESYGPNDYISRKTMAVIAVRSMLTLMTQTEFDPQILNHARVSQLNPLLILESFDIYKSLYENIDDLTGTDDILDALLSNDDVDTTDILLEILAIDLEESRNTAMDIQRKADLHKIQAAVISYSLTYGTYPTDIYDGSIDEFLVSEVRTDPDTNAGYYYSTDEVSDFVLSASLSTGDCYTLSDSGEYPIDECVE